MTASNPVYKRLDDDVKIVQGQCIIVAPPVEDIDYLSVVARAPEMSVGSIFTSVM